MRAQCAILERELESRCKGRVMRVQLCNRQVYACACVLVRVRVQGECVHVCVCVSVSVCVFAYCVQASVVHLFLLYSVRISFSWMQGLLVVWRTCSHTQVWTRVFGLDKNVFVRKYHDSSDTSLTSPVPHNQMATTQLHMGDVVQQVLDLFADIRQLLHENGLTCTRSAHFQLLPVLPKFKNAHPHAHMHTCTHGHTWHHVHAHAHCARTRTHTHIHIDAPSLHTPQESKNYR